MRAALVGLAALLSACTVDLHLEDVVFPCAEDADCAGDAVCGRDNRCVPLMDASVMGDAGTSAGSPRPIAPISGSELTTPYPHFRWAPIEGRTCGQLCRKRSCASPERTFESIESGVVADRPLEPGVWWWRVFRCGEEPGTAPIWELVSPHARTATVARVAGTFLDLNGDGIGEHAVGAPRTVAKQGYALVFTGTTSGLATDPSTTITEDQVVGRGWSVAAAGDVNGDGFVDLVVGCNGNVEGPAPVQIFHGGPSGIRALPDEVLERHEFARHGFGNSVAPAGDVDGDGYADVLVGVRRFNLALLYWGSPRSLLLREPAQLLAPANLGLLGNETVSAVGDLDGDGLGDIAIGSYGMAGGAVSVLFGSGSRDLVTAFVLTSTVPNTALGVAIVNAGDVDGDGFPDLAVGTGVGSQIGRVHIYRGNGRSLDRLPWATLVDPEGTAGLFGAALAAGDLDADGHADIAVGVATSGPRPGSAYVYLGGASAMGPPITLERGVDAEDNSFGRAVGGGDDLDGDGIGDLLVGAPFREGYRGGVLKYKGRTPLVGPLLPSGQYFAREPSELGFAVTH